MTDRQNQEVLTWLQTHPATTCHSLSRYLRLPLDATRSLLLSVIQYLGKDKFRLIYCIQKEGTTLELVSAGDMMDVESEDMVLFAVQAKESTADSVHQIELGVKGMNLRESLAAGRLEVNHLDGIPPIPQEVRELLPHRKRKVPGAAISAGKSEVGATKSQPVPTASKAAVLKTKPAVKSQTTLPTQKPSTPVLPATPPVKLQHKEIESTSSETKTASPLEEPAKPAKTHNHVSFSEDTNMHEQEVRRRSTPHPSKVKKCTDAGGLNLDSSLYTVEEDDTDTIFTPAPNLKRARQDPPQVPQSQGSQVSTVEKAPTEGFKRMKVSTTSTFVDSKGYMVSRDTVKEEVVKVQSLPSNSHQSTGIAHKKGKQQVIGSYFQKRE